MWVTAACVFGVGEMLTTRLLLAPLALGAALAALLGAAGSRGTVLWLAFAVVTLLGLLVARPIARSRRRRQVEFRARTAALIGKQAIVLEQIANSEGVGCIKIDGALWTARALDDDHVIERGTRVEVVDIRGATALVAE